MRKEPDCRVILSIIAVLALLGAVVPAWAESPVAARTAESAKDATSSAGGPRVQFAALEYDFGQALSGEDLKTKFTFKNVGDGVLVIEKVKGG
jgi:hypothetical protein